METSLPLRKKLAYGLGHIQNDLCASMWFTYLLLFFHQVLNFNNIYSGIILLVGQIADGVSTTIVGALCDGNSEEGAWLCRKYGQRKAWHLIGTLCVTLSFPFLFQSCLGGQDSDEWAQLIYYSAFAIVFQFGWASVQISHLALIPAITSSQNERTGLTAIRYGLTVFSNITVYVITWVILGQGGEGMIGQEDRIKFRNIMLIVVAIGVVASIAFHVCITEEVDQVPSSYEEINGDPRTLDLVQPMSMADWFREPQFYQVGCLYMATRLFVNLCQAYIPIYIQESLKLDSEYVAIIPLTMYSSGFITSFLMKVLNRKAGRKVAYLLGAAVGLAAAVWVFWGDTWSFEWFKQYGIFLVSVLYGVGSCAVLITSLSITAELIGPNTESAAFVYGAMSFTDKVSNGLAVMAIQKNIPLINDCAACRWYFRDVLFFACGGAALLGSLALASFGTAKIGERRRDRRDASSEEERQRLLPGDSPPPVYT